MVRLDGKPFLFGGTYKRHVVGEGSCMGDQDAQGLVGKLGALAKSVEMVRRGLREYSKLRDDLVTNANRLQQILSRIEKASESFTPEEVRASLQAWLSTEKSLLEGARKQLQSRFGLDLERILKENGFDLRGQYPRLQASFYTIKLDFEHGKVTLWYGPEEELISALPLDAKRVAGALVKFHQGLTQRPFNDAHFLKELYTAYLNILKRDEGQEGEKIPITSLMAELAYMRQDRRFRADPRRINFQDYGRTLFSYDLYRMKKDIQGRRMMLVTATRLQVRNREQYLWVPVNEKGDGTVYSEIHFGGL